MIYIYEQAAKLVRKCCRNVERKEAHPHFLTNTASSDQNYGYKYKTIY